MSRETCVCACVRTFAICLGVLRALLTNPLLRHCICSIFWSLFVHLPCRKPEIVFLEFNCLVCFGRLAWTSAACTYFADKFTTAKRTDGTLYEILLDTQLSFGFCVGLVWLKETPAHRTAASLWLRSYLRRCTTEPTPHLHPAMFVEVTNAMHVQNKLFLQLGSRDVKFRTLSCTQQLQHCPAEADQEMCAAPACPTGICHGEVRPFIAEASSSLVGSPPQPQNVGRSGQQTSWHQGESTFVLRHAYGKGKQRLVGFGLRMPKLKMK